LCPISKKLPWMNMESIPPEFFEDAANNRNVNQRYYIAKVLDWKVPE